MIAFDKRFDRFGLKVRRPHLHIFLGLEIYFERLLPRWIFLGLEIYFEYYSSDKFFFFRCRPFGKLQISQKLPVGF